MKAQTLPTIYVLSRVAGEAQTAMQIKGDYYLKDDEHQMVADLLQILQNIIIIIYQCRRTGGAFLYGSFPISKHFWSLQPGMEGGNAFADVISGRVNHLESWVDSGHINVELSKRSYFFPQ